MTAPRKIAAERAVQFLCDHQMPNGEFRTLAAPGPDMTRSVPYGSPFVTTFVLYSLRNCRDQRWETVRQRALLFLLSEQHPGGWWRNHNRDNPYHRESQLPFDLDDTCAVSQILEYYGIPFSDNKSAILANVNDSGLFLTWVNPDFENEVDGVVNANVLFYLGLEIPSVIDDLCQSVLHAKPFSQWYRDPLIFYYMIARAFEKGIARLQSVSVAIIQQIEEMQCADGRFGNHLQTALAVNILNKFNHHQPSFFRGVSALIRTQSQDGSWGVCPFYRGWNNHYGSTALTTALAFEALLLDENQLAHDE